ncbi:MAG: bifunctional hydroxymethylpyrimidine kinase/phosphomethylpyrimidine kinase [Nevskia sp.]|nr:bifunctional hydroxymethylpyrimidine kinase/phosphomethylpyrimidine kinase [Nevskia sp.]
MPAPRPLLLCLSGLDPTGGAGLQADIETAAALGAHALGLVTALTVQDTRNVAEVAPTDAALLERQLRRLLDDVRPQAIKLGLLGSAAQVPVVGRAIDRCRVPVVCDPVLRAGGGAELAGAGLVQALREELLPRLTLLTPNAAEARRLAGTDALEDCGPRLLRAGCANVLVTGGDEPGTEVVNTWFTAGAAPRHFRWPRLPETFHGAGCTLAAAVAALLAGGAALDQAIAQAQAWTHAALAQAIAVGGGRRIPWRRP